MSSLCLYLVWKVISCPVQTWAATCIHKAQPIPPPTHTHITPYMTIMTIYTHTLPIVGNGYLGDPWHLQVNLQCLHSGHSCTHRRAQRAGMQSLPVVPRRRWRRSRGTAPNKCSACTSYRAPLRRWCNFGIHCFLLSTTCGPLPPCGPLCDHSHQVDHSVTTPTTWTTL